MLALVPDVLRGKQIEVCRAVSPRTGKLARYVVNDEGIWELLRVPSPAHLPKKASGRSAVVGDQVVSDASFAVLTPVNPVYMFLRTLWSNRGKAMPLDLLRELAAGDGVPIPLRMWKAHAATICTVNDDDNALLDLDKLRKWLTEKVEHMIVNLPASIGAAAESAVAPLEYGAVTDPALIQGARRHAAIGLVTSWLPPTVSEWAHGELETSEVLAARKEAQELALARQRQRAAQTLTEGSKRAASAIAVNKVAKRAKPEPKKPKGKYISLTDMFKPKAK